MMALPLAANGAVAPPRAILFDWDNTLVDSWATIHEALNFVMAAMEAHLVAGRHPGASAAQPA